eukprot:2154812-Rhodomonas_salina.1
MSSTGIRCPTQSPVLKHAALCIQCPVLPYAVLCCWYKLAYAVSGTAIRCSMVLVSAILCGARYCHTLLYGTGKRCPMRCPAMPLPDEERGGDDVRSDQGTAKEA